jgi:hypothetical protein
VGQAIDAVNAAILQVPPDASARSARFALVLRASQDTLALAIKVAAAFASLAARSRLERRVLVLDFPGRVFRAEDRATRSRGSTVRRRARLASEPYASRRGRIRLCRA